MTHIKMVSESDATGELAEVYNAHMGRTGIPFVSDILKCFSARPDFLQQIIDMSMSLHFRNGHLLHRTKEMLSTYVSALNQCRY
jgi:hypothetical protein